MNNGDRNHYLLLGAGFSRTWGGWLASEVFEYIIGIDEVRSDIDILNVLWSKQRPTVGGGFEAALDHFQRQFRNDKNSAHLNQMRILQNACVEALQVMDEAMLAQAPMNSFNLRSSQNTGLDAFLKKFDVIFSLNQDTVLERGYLPNWHTNHVNGRVRSCLPGVPSSPPVGMLGIDKNRMAIQKQSMPKISAKEQPVLKLHGSWNWIHEGNDPLLVLGGNKSTAISESPLLSSYHQFFHDKLCQSNSRLMVIGYGFGDDHINSVLSIAIRNGLKLFIVDPVGHELIKHIKMDSVDQVPLLERALIGASRRSLATTFNSDEVERKKLLRFFD